MSSESSTAPLRAGDIVAGKYRIERELGVGGMGVVLLATHLEIGQKVAIKFLFPQFASNAVSALRFLREAQAAVSLTSDHAVRVHDVGRLDSGAPYMVMEYLEGRDLGRVVQEEGALPIDRCVDYVLQAIDAIAEAHAAGIVHRDLKPSNLFLAKRGRGHRIKVLDFGISKLASDASTNFELTKTAAVLGSPLYMAPEQMRSTRTVDQRADIWSLGVILYELAAGSLPFQAQALPELCLIIAQDPPLPLRGARTDVPEELERIIMRCLEKAPDDRFASVAELADALERVRGSGHSVSSPALAPTSANPSDPGSAPALLVAPITASGPQPSVGARTSPEVTWGRSGTLPPQRPASKRWLLGAVGAMTVALAIGLYFMRARVPAPVNTVASSPPPETSALAATTTSASAAAAAAPPVSVAAPSAAPSASAVPESSGKKVVRPPVNVAGRPVASPPSKPLAPKPPASAPDSTFSHDRQ